MALMNDPKIDKRSKAYKDSLANASQEANTGNTQSIVGNTASNSINETTLMIEMQAQMRAMADEIKELKKPKVNVWDKAKEIYSGPRDYSYKTWNDVPVCSYVSKKSDPTKALVDKNKHGQYESNHILVLTLADGETTEVDIDIFGANFGRSDPMKAKVLPDPYDPSVIIGYEFSTDKYPSFIIIPNLIN